MYLKSKGYLIQKVDFFNFQYKCVELNFQQLFKSQLGHQTHKKKFIHEKLKNITFLAAILRCAQSKTNNTKFF